MFFRLLPWEYAIRNLFRRPLRTVLTFVGLTTVILMVLVVVFALGMGENLEYSSIEMSTSDIVAASVEGIEERYGHKYVSPELYSGTEVTVGDSGKPDMGLVRGLTPSALSVRRRVELEEGTWPKSGEVL